MIRSEGPQLPHPLKETGLYQPKPSARECRPIIMPGEWFKFRDYANEQAKRLAREAGLR